MKKKSGVHWKKSMTVTIALILLMIIGSVIVTRQINRMEEERSFDQLYEETNAMAKEIVSHANRDREQLEMLATVIAGYSDLSDAKLWDILDSYDAVGMMSRLELLLPDDTVLTKGGRTVDAGGRLSFAAACDLGAHITDREVDLTSQRYILRHYVPVVRNGETVAMLYGVVELGSLPETLLSTPYGGDAAVYIIDGSTGDFLVDTWHDKPGNIWALGERPMAPGYDHEQLKEGLIDGKTGYVVFVSQTIGKYLYFYYEPIGINDWRAALSVSEDVVFSGANDIKQILYIFLGFEAICFALYFLWMLHYVRRETGVKQHQLDTINYVYDVEKLLFNAHEQQENITTALERIAQITSAEKVGFWMLEQSAGDVSYLWENSGARMEGNPLEIKELIYRLAAYFKAGNSQFEAYDSKDFGAILSADEYVPAKNLIAVPVKRIDGRICGILAACDMTDKKGKAALLKGVSYSFGMFCHNVHTYNEIKKLSEKDTLVGLYNRNRYEMDLPKYLKQYKKSLACVYVDVNGLHELNNIAGHAAGDKMLQSVARQMNKAFGSQVAYRIGGDEFLVFAVDMEEDTVNRLCRQMQENLEKEDISISVGVAWRTKVQAMDDLVKAAEQKMYAAKKQYYEKTEHDRRQRGSGRNTRQSHREKECL